MTVSSVHGKDALMVSSLRALLIPTGNKWSGRGPSNGTVPPKDRGLINVLIWERGVILSSFPTSPFVNMAASRSCDRMGKSLELSSFSYTPAHQERHATISSSFSGRERSSFRISSKVMFLMSPRLCRDVVMDCAPEKISSGRTGKFFRKLEKVESGRRTLEDGWTPWVERIENWLLEEHEKKAASRMFETSAEGVDG